MKYLSLKYIWKYLKGQGHDIFYLLVFSSIKSNWASYFFYSFLIGRLLWIRKYTNLTLIIQNIAVMDFLFKVPKLFKHGSLSQALGSRLESWLVSCLIVPWVAKQRDLRYSTGTATGSLDQHTKAQGLRWFALFKQVQLRPLRPLVGLQNFCHLIFKVNFCCSGCRHAREDVDWATGFRTECSRPRWTKIQYKGGGGNFLLFGRFPKCIL